MIYLKADGSGTIEEEMVFGAQAIGMIEMAAAQGGDGDNPLADLLDPEKAKTNAAKWGEEVEFVKVEPIERNGGKGSKITYKFKDINKVKVNPGEALNDMGEDAGADAAEPVTFVYQDKTLTINMPQPEKAEGDEAAPEAPAVDPNDPETAMAMQMVKGMKMSAKVVVEGGIAKTNATYHEGDEITIMEMNFDEMMKNPKAFQILQGMEGADPGTMKAELAKLEGVKAETQEKVTVTLK